MRTILFLFILNNCFGQLTLSKTELFVQQSIDSLIIGDWFLKETILAQSYSKDSIPIIRNEVNQNKKITLTYDSLIIHPFSDRFYKAYEGYNYKIQQRDIKLFLGSKKKKREVGKYSIVQCTFNELILCSFERFDSPFYTEFFTVYYIYHRNNEYKSLLSQLYGNWSVCSEKPIPFFSGDTINKIILHKDSTCQNNTHSLSLEFMRQEIDMSNVYSITSFGYNLGVFLAPRPFYLDTFKKLIFLTGKETQVYKYEIIEPDIISLELIQSIPIKR